MKLRVLSLGAGVQSTTLALMASRGEIDMPDCAIFADTQSEPAAVYEHLRWLMSPNVLPFPVHIVTVGSLRDDLVRGTNSAHRKRFAAIPYFLDRLQQHQPDGIGRRQCTREYKIDPMATKQRELLGKGPRERIGKGTVEVWLGISTDEAHRCKPSRSAWQINRFPLIEKGMRRSDCLAWLARHDYPRPPKSACTFCPYRSDESWLMLRTTSPADWEDACKVDEALRRNQHELRLNATPYLHRSLRPLREADLGGGMNDLFGNECEGHCGV